MVERIKNLGYHPTPQTTGREGLQAFYRKAANADFVVLIEEPMQVATRRAPLPGHEPPPPGAHAVR